MTQQEADESTAAAIRILRQLVAAWEQKKMLEFHSGIVAAKQLLGQ